MDMSQVIQPKSDQLGADDLLSGPRTITITDIKIVAGEQPVTISYKGDEGRPWKPCKSMARVLVACWGPDANKYVGRSLTLYRDPNVRWGGLEVGGIRVSHVSDISGPQVMALTVTRGNKKPFTVRPLVVEEKKRTLGDWLADLEKSLSMAESEEEISAILETPEVLKVLSGTNEKAKSKIDELSKWARELLSKNYQTEPTLPKPWPIPEIEACLSETDLMRLQNSTAYVTALPTLSVDVMKQVTEAVADAHRRFA